MSRARGTASQPQGRSIFGLFKELRKIHWAFEGKERTWKRP